MNTNQGSVICDAEDIDSATLKFLSKKLTPKDKLWFDSLLRITIRKNDRFRILALKYKRETD